MPYKICTQQGCNTLVPQGKSRCPKHEVKDSTTQRFYDQQRKFDKYTLFYKSPEWMRTRKFVLNRDSSLCQDCLSRGRYSPASTVHHIVELKEDWTLRLDLMNLISVCHSCHNTIHGRYSKSKDKEVSRLRSIVKRRGGGRRKVL